MFEEFFERPHILERHRTGPFALQRHRYLTHLQQIGQSHQRLLVIGKLLLQAAALVKIDNREPVKLKVLKKAAVDWLRQRSRPNTQPRSLQIAKTDFTSAVSKWLRFLGYLEEEVHPSLPFASQLNEFLRQLRDERGLADSTVQHRKRSLETFLRWLASRRRTIATVEPTTFTEYFSIQRSPSWKRATVKSYAESLRTFFRYAESHSWCNAGIASTIDAPRIYSLESLPQGPKWKDVQRLITSVNGDRPTLIRNRAIILLLAVYGFRMSEVCQLTLDDICWESDLIRVRRCKQRKVQDYPLTAEVGAAILRYLRDARPRSPYREIFLTLRTPYRPALRNVGSEIGELMNRSGIQLPRCGPHLLRHACACHLLSEGFSLKEIGDHLGHRSAQATQIYAKVDLSSLRPVAHRDLSDLIQYAETRQPEARSTLTGERLAMLREVARLNLGGVL